MMDLQDSELVMGEMMQTVPWAYSQFLEQVLTTVQEMQLQLERALNSILSLKEQWNGSRSL